MCTQIDHLFKLHSILEKKNWNILFEQLDMPVVESLVEMMGRLSHEEFSLILDILPAYCFIDPNTLESFFRKTLRGIPEGIILSHDNIFVMPLKEARVDTAKSTSGPSYAVTYNIRRLFKRNKEVVGYDSLSSFSANKKLTERENALILFVDDFIGSGDSAIKVCKEFDRDFRRPDDKMIIVAPVCLQRGYDNIKEHGYCVATYCKLQRGITDSEIIQDKEKAIQTMMKISGRLKINESYHLGFKKSEALCSFAVRSPNNTFPVFWVDQCKDGTIWPAPFFR